MIKKRPRLVPIGRLPGPLLRATDNRLRRDGLSASGSIKTALADRGYQVTDKDLLSRKTLIDYVDEKQSTFTISPLAFESEAARDWSAEYMALEFQKRAIEDRQRVLWDRLQDEAEGYEGFWGWMLGEAESESEQFMELFGPGGHADRMQAARMPDPETED